MMYAEAVGLRIKGHSQQESEGRTDNNRVEEEEEEKKRRGEEEKRRKEEEGERGLKGVQALP